MDDSARSVDQAVSHAIADLYAAFDDNNIRQAFKDLDDPNNLELLMRHVQSSVSRNFVLDYCDESAYVAFDLPTTSIANLFSVEMPVINARWLNIWYPFHNRPLLELIAQRYDFSPRLLAMMCSDPRQLKRTSTKHSVNVAPAKKFWTCRSPRSSTETELEKGIDELSEHSSITSELSITRGNLYRIIDDIWHYSSVDMGRNYLCVGYNSLYGTKHAGSEEGNGLLPYCTRVWTWLIITDDNTVISINEDPFPYSDGRLDSLQLCILAETRRNLTNVFRSLAKVDQRQLMASNPMSILPIRTRIGNTPEETAHRESDTPGLLFYYLFENWQNSYTLVTRKESRYGVELNELRNQMFDSPKLRHIDRLDNIGKELGVLKRHYKSYTRIVERLVESQRATATSLQNSQVVSETSETSLNTIRPLVTQQESMLGVSLSSAARVRFRRLADLIDLYALSEVEEYIKQKESLVALNFNLIAMKESEQTERLTRITLLITKATILFLPVSLMSAYFSVQLQGQDYTVAEYWISFAVILFLSWIALFIFGVFSGSVETTDFWRAICRGFKGVKREVVRMFGQ
ncbi:hypothetical protein EJ03DRAFT_269461 [Teratosphaeria nubilosa]|uniref:ADP-ribosylation factor n=1 Tax=Teratosphaeria nubilosa TaxID=161662 RepID=A0A6G1LDK0_9PEZI|nr:hypothetical protein EJ03DRAFT_269461 [Teratosphaeria nubilosa]